MKFPDHSHKITCAARIGMGGCTCSRVAKKPSKRKRAPALKQPKCDEWISQRFGRAAGQLAANHNPIKHKPAPTSTDIERLDAAIKAAVEKDGPILLWVGEVYPENARLRGLNLSHTNLSKWIDAAMSARKGK